MKYYVYNHVDPISGEVLYVGKGSGGRAWDTSRNRKFCHPEHYQWIEFLLNLGYTPEDYVKITHKSLSQEEAFFYEKEYLHTHGQPKYNRTAGERNHKAKLTDEQAREIYQSSVKVKTLAETYGVSRAAIYHIKKGTQWRSATSNIRS